MKTEQEHRVWLEGLSDDELLIVRTPPGYLFMMLVVADVKRALTGGLSPDSALDLLERMHRLVDGYFTAEMMAAIEPASDVEAAMMRVAHRLDPPGAIPPMKNGFDLLTDPEVFFQFVKVNPSILTAIKMREQRKAA